jgi:hypothetical protein
MKIPRHQRLPGSLHQGRLGLPVPTTPGTTTTTTGAPVGTGIGTANIQFSPTDTSPAIITTPASTVISAGGSITVTYCIIGATSAWINDREDGTNISLICDGAQHTATFSPSMSGDYPIFAQDAAGNIVVQPMPFIVQESLPAIDPNGAATNTTTGPGSWKDGTKWSAGRAPTRDEIVAVNHAMTVSGRGNICGQAVVNSGGSITISNGALVVSNLSVYTAGATFTIDSSGGGGPAILMLRNRPVHANDTTHDYPGIYVGGGSSSTATDGGKFITRGPQPTPYARLAAEALAGATSVTLQTAVANWRVGDKVLIPDSRQLNSSEITGYNNAGKTTFKYDIAVVRGVSTDGKTVYFLNPILYDHKGARTLDGTLVTDCLPHVTNLYRQSLIATSDPTDVNNRGHLRFSGRATCDMMNTTVHGTGRLTRAQVNASGFNFFNQNHLPVQFYYYIGPNTNLAPGCQGRLENCVVLDPVPIVPDPVAVWPITIMNSYYVLLKNNTVFNWDGSGILLIDKYSSYNTFDGNFVSVLTGVGDRFTSGPDLTGSPNFLPDGGLHGTGIQVNSPRNKVVNNVCNAVTCSAVVSGHFQHLSVGISLIFTKCDTAAKIPAYQGADPAVAGQYVTVDMINCPFGSSQTGSGDYDNNECYGVMDMGFEWWSINERESMDGTSTITTYLSNQKVWHIHWQICFPYYGNYVVVQNLRAYGELANFADGSQPRGLVNADYRMKHLVFDGCHFEGLGANQPTTAGTGCGIGDIFDITFQNCYFRMLSPLDLSDRWTSGGSLWTTFGNRISTLDNNTYVAVPGYALRIVHMYAGDQGPNANWVQPDQVFVNHFDGVSGPGTHSYQVYWTQSLPSSVPPTTGSSPATGVGPVASPAAGQTCQYLHDNYNPPDGTGQSSQKIPANSATAGLTMKGDLVPAGTITIAGFDGGTSSTVTPCPIRQIS